MEANRTVSEGAGAGEARRIFGSSISTLAPAKAATDPAPRRTKSRRVIGNIFFMVGQNLLGKILERSIL
jgi:hypothetical protein